MNRDMNVILDALEIDDRCKVLVLTGAGDAFTAGMDLREFFRETAGFDPIKRRRTMAQATTGSGGSCAISPSRRSRWSTAGRSAGVSSARRVRPRDRRRRRDIRRFGDQLGIIPAGNVTKAIEAVLNERQALRYIMTGDPFDGKKAAEIGLVTEAVPRDSCASQSSRSRKSS